MSLLKENQQFAGYTVGEKLSTHHDGLREVYDVTTDLSDCPHGIMIVYRGERPKAWSERVDDSVADSEAGLMSSPDCFPPEFYAAHELNKRGFAADTVATGWCEAEPGQWLAYMVKVGVSMYPLSDNLRHGGAYTVTDAIKLTRRLCDAVTALGGCGFGGGHFNLSPEHLLIGHPTEVSIIGTSCASVRLAPGETPKMADAETPDRRYRAPETFRGEYTLCSEVFALGTIFAELLAGRYPWEVDDWRTIDEEEYLRRRNEAWKRGDALASVSRAAYTLIKKATEPDPARRLKDPEQFKKFLNYLTIISKDGAERNPAAEEPSAETRQEPLGGFYVPPDQEPEAAPETQGTSDKGAGGDKAQPSPSASLPRKGRGAQEGVELKKSADGSLDDVAGMDALKNELRRNFVDILGNVEIARQYGITAPNGILLYGPPGCGKTFVAQKAASESGLNYRLVNPSDFGSVYIHGSQGKIAAAFREAEKQRPIILVLDEFDAMSPRRDNESGANQANEVNEFLTQMNNCADRGIYVVATTNRPDMIDPALLRKGRFDQKVYVGLPDREARAELLRMELRHRPCAPDIDIDALAGATDRFTCSDLAYVVKETARRCFAETIGAASATPGGSRQLVQLSQRRLLDTIAGTNPSVSNEQMRQYERLRLQMEERDGSPHPRVGFATAAKTL